MTRPLVLVHGTYGRAEAWHLPGSEFRAEAEAHGFTVFDFLWSGALFGVPTPLPGDPFESMNGADAGDLLGWLDAGEKLALFMDAPLEIGRPCVISHSHGLQVVAFSTWRNATYDVAVSVSGPIRRDMQRARRRAASSIRRWCQFADPDADRFVRIGEWFGGAHESVALPEGETILTPGSGHAGLLNDATLRASCGFWKHVVGKSADVPA